MARDVAKLRALAKSILALKDLRTSSVDRCEVGGRFVAEALKCGALGHSEDVDCRIHVEMRLAHTGVNPFISTWAEAGDRLRHGVGPFPPRDLDSDFTEDCELIANALMAECEAVDEGPMLDADDVEILEHLRRSGTKVIQDDIAAAVVHDTKTVSKRLKRLRDLGLTHRDGDRGGDAITQAGRDWLKEHHSG